MTVKATLEELHQSILAGEDINAIRAHEKIISRFFDESLEIPEFYSLPIQNINSILSKSKQTCLN
jgi:hypothetical protein